MSFLPYGSLTDNPVAVKVIVKLVKAKQSPFGSGQAVRNPGTEAPRFEDCRHKIW